jgi:hypothetical protein
MIATEKGKGGFCNDLIDKVWIVPYPYWNDPYKSSGEDLAVNRAIAGADRKRAYLGRGAAMPGNGLSL